MVADDWLISADELSALSGNAAVRIVDCRFNLMEPDAGRRDYLDGHIPGAVFVDLDRDLAAPLSTGTGRHPLPDPDQFAATMGALGVSNDTKVVVYDEASGALAARTWWLLRWAGHDDVRLLDGGITAWTMRDLPLESGQREHTPARFQARPRPELVLTVEEILAAGDAVDRLQLVDARDAARFEGRVEPIDAVAGHIPGAVNLPFAAALHENGTWRSPDELRRLWDDTLGDGAGAPWSVMCGSGVTACHLVISGLLAGLPEPRVYIGSWSEWISDPERPVA